MQPSWMFHFTPQHATQLDATLVCGLVSSAAPEIRRRVKEWVGGWRNLAKKCGLSLPQVTFIFSTFVDPNLFRPTLPSIPFLHTFQTTFKTQMDRSGDLHGKLEKTQLWGGRTKSRVSNRKFVSPKARYSFLPSIECDSQRLLLLYLLSNLISESLSVLNKVINNFKKDCSSIL